MSGEPEILSEQAITDWLQLAHVDSDIPDWAVRDSHEALRAEVTRLREALEEALDHPFPVGAYDRWRANGNTEDANRMDEYDARIRRLRAALSEKGEQSERCPTCGSNNPLTFLIKIAQDSTIGLPYGSESCSDPWHSEKGKPTEPEPVDWERHATVALEAMTDERCPTCDGTGWYQDSSWVRPRRCPDPWHKEKGEQP